MVAQLNDFPINNMKRKKETTVLLKTFFSVFPKIADKREGCSNP